MEHQLVSCLFRQHRLEGNRTRMMHPPTSSMLKFRHYSFNSLCRKFVFLHVVKLGTETMFCPLSRWPVKVVEWSGFGTQVGQRLRRSRAFRCEVLLDLSRVWAPWISSDLLHLVKYWAAPILGGGMRSREIFSQLDTSLVSFPAGFWGVLVPILAWLCCSPVLSPVSLVLLSPFGEVRDESWCRDLLALCAAPVLPICFITGHGFGLQFGQCRWPRFWLRVSCVLAVGDMFGVRASIVSWFRPDLASIALLSCLLPIEVVACAWVVGFGVSFCL
ncbi:unnamed protein product [Fraxinus pennsylvanica]|uniref:Transmembrane protein n=1 Tax=Fraxinus pennsylvanica TaxID=56036 RepID=A0AAD2ACD6_9LAMI|nr:unnamed protein product [Fraxinus pennsylvanica]